MESQEEQYEELVEESKNGSLEKVIELLNDKTFNVNYHDGVLDETPLFVASKYGHSDVVNALLKHGANVNQAIRDGTTPLYIASKYGRLDVVNALLKHGADVDKAEPYKLTTPLYIASKYGHSDVVKALLEHGTDVNSGMVLDAKNKLTPIMAAGGSGHIRSRCESGAT
jgi:ankyrin repeat protein